MTRRHWTVLFCLILLCALTGSPRPVGAASAREVLTNESVRQMVELGFADELIIAKIGASALDFDTSLTGLKALKDAGVSDEVLAAMTRGVTETESVVSDPNDPLAPHDKGIYLYEETSHGLKLTEIHPTLSMQSKTGGIWKNAYSFGAAKVKNRAILHGLHSQFAVGEKRPVFYFYFGDEEEDFGGISPREFALVRLKSKQDKGWREVIVGTFNITGGQSGVMDKFAIAFTSVELAPGIHRVTPNTSLEDGEYGFYYGGSSPGPIGYHFAGAGSGVKIFDFCRHAGGQHRAAGSAGGS